MSSTRLARLVASAVALAAPVPLLAQSSPATGSAFEVRVPSGHFIGTGDQRGQLKNANATAVQLSWLVRPQLAVTGTFSWARSRDLAAGNAPKLDVFTSDLGLEVRTATHQGPARLDFSGFAGLGAGARSYNHRSLDVAATHNIAGYAAVGGAARLGRVGVRLEARDYATGFRPLVGRGTSTLRNDVVVMVAITLHSGRGAVR